MTEREKCEAQVSRDSKKVLFVISHYAVSGPAVTLKALLQRVDHSKFEVAVVALSPDGSLRHELNALAQIVDVPTVVTAFTLPARRVGWALAQLARFSLRLAGAGALVLAQHLLLKQSMKVGRQRLWKKYGTRLPKLDGQYDVAIGFGSAFTTYFVADCVEARRKYHSVIADDRILGTDTGIEAEYFGKIDGALAVSASTARIFGDRYPLMKDKTRVLYNYISEDFDSALKDSVKEQQESQPTSPIIVSSMRLDPLKGLGILLDAAALLQDRGVDFKWLVLGDGPERHKVEQRISTLGLSNSVLLPGFVENPAPIFARAHVFVHPSETEGKSHAIDEAKYMGLPIVVTEFETVGEQVVDGLNGLVTKFSGASVADAVEHILNDVSLRNSIADRNRGTSDSDKNGDLNTYLEMLCE